MPKPTEKLAFPNVMAELEKSGSAQTRKTYARHGVPEPMFGVSFATLKTLKKRIGVDHELALALWETGNFDARNLAVKIVDPARLSASELDAWAAEPSSKLCGGYVAMLPAEGSRGAATMKKWLASKKENLRIAGWVLLGQLAQRDEDLPDDVFLTRIAEIEKSIHKAPNSERDAMNTTLIQLGLRNPALKKAALAAAKRIGKVEIDHGDTACKTADAAAYIDKAWAHSTSKGFKSPAEHERSRDVPRLRC